MTPAPTSAMSPAGGAILHGEAGHPACARFQFGHGVGAAVHDPEDVHLPVDQIRVGAVEQQVDGTRPVRARAHLPVVVVVAEAEAGGAGGLTGPVEVVRNPPQRLPVALGGWKGRHHHQALAERDGGLQGRLPTAPHLLHRVVARGGPPAPPRPAGPSSPARTSRTGPPARPPRSRSRRSRRGCLPGRRSSPSAPCRAAPRWQKAPGTRARRHPSRDVPRSQRAIPPPDPKPGRASAARRPPRPPLEGLPESGGGRASPPRPCRSRDPPHARPRGCSQARCSPGQALTPHHRISRSLMLRNQTRFP